jgi:AcrR family transcriptional regulator
MTRAEQREETRRRLIEAAGRVFARTGFEAAAIDTITEEAGYSRGAFYSNFQSKDELFIELFKAHNDAEIETLGRALGRIERAEDLAALIERRYHVLGEDSSWCLMTTEFQLYAMRGGKMADTFAAVYEDYRQRIGGLVAAQFERFNLESDLTPYEFAAAQIALSHGLALQRAADSNLSKTLPARALAAFVRGAVQRSNEA